MSFWDNNPASMAAASLGGGMAGGVTSLPGVASMTGGSLAGGVTSLPSIAPGPGDQGTQTNIVAQGGTGPGAMPLASPSTGFQTYTAQGATGDGSMPITGQAQSPSALGGSFGSTLASLGGMGGGMGSPQTSYGSSGYGSPQAGQMPTGDTGYAQMRAPNGDTDWVHPDHVDHYTSLGATRL